MPEVRKTAASGKGHPTMNRTALVSVSILLLGVGGFLLSLNGCGGSSSASLTTTQPASKIQHVVIIFQENRTPDNLFQGLCIPPYGSTSACSTNPSSSQYNIQSYGVNSSGQMITLSQLDLGTSGANPDNYDISHSHLTGFVPMCNANSAGICQMTGANNITPITCTAGAANCPPPAGTAEFMYVNPNDVAAYLQMAQTYAFADQMFQTNQGPSFPAHQYIISGTSTPSVGSNLFDAENPAGVPAGTNAGCIAPSDETVAMIDPSGSESTTMYPCFEHPTLTDLLDKANLTWRYYAPSAGSIWTGPTAINHMCVPSAPAGGTCTGTDYSSATPNVVVNQTQSNAQIITDIANNQLQQVSWVIPAGQFSDHARVNTGCGPSWVTQVVNAIGNSPYWSNTAIIVTWDDWGGWYDHVPPPKMLNSYEYGFRVPMLVISPYIVKSGYISHNTHDFGSILKFIETTFNLPSLGYADAPADDLSDFFTFSQSPMAFQAITPPGNTAACIAATDAPADPDDD
jgi:phospholipase C